MDIINDPQTQSSYNLASITSVSDVELTENMSYNQRIYPRQISSGSLRGTQQVGYGGVKIDGSNNQIVIGVTTNSQGQKQEALVGQLGTSINDQSFGLKVIDAFGASLSFGILSDGNLGIQLVDKNGNEVMRSGLLPVSGLYGWAAATPGNNLTGQV